MNKEKQSSDRFVAHIENRLDERQLKTDRRSNQVQSCIFRLHNIDRRERTNRRIIH